MKSVYICSSLRPEVYKHVSQVLTIVAKEEKLYRPQPGPIDNRNEIVASDCYGIEHCDELWVVGQLGRDCSWEIGYAMGLGKKVKIYVDSTNREMIEKDWMLHYGFKLGLLEFIDMELGKK